MGEKKDKENMAKKKDTDIRFWGLSLAIFLIFSIFCCCMYGASKIYVDNKIEKNIHEFSWVGV